MTTAPRSVPAPVQSAIQTAYRALMARGGTRRRSQQMMIGAIASAVANAKRYGDDATGERLLAVQAPTGTGKTYAYGVGAIPVALAAGLKVVISSATIALQDQIVGKDLVALKAVLPEIEPLLVKGRGRYACPVKLAEAAAGEGAGRNESVRGVAIQLARLLDRREWNGDVDALSEQPDSGTWAAFTNDRNGCAGKRCSRYDRCPYQNERAKIERANVLVVNHSLLLSDAIAGNHVLPLTADSVLVIDEAHELPAKAIDAFEGQCAIDDAKKLTMRARSVMANVRARSRMTPLGEQAALTAGELERLAAGLDEAAAAIDSMGKTTDVRDPKRAVRFQMGKLPARLDRAARECRDAAKGVADGLTRMVEMLDDDEGESVGGEQQERMLADVGSLAGKIDGVLTAWRLMAAEEMAGCPVAKWLEIDAEGDDLRVCASPLAAGSLLHDLLWSQCAASIHLSATLTTVGGFSHYLDDSGLALTPGVNTLDVPSPFDYSTQAALTVPKGMTSPKDADAHTADLTTRLQTMLGAMSAGTGALVLFSSWKQLNAVYEAMEEPLKSLLLVQGGGLSKGEIIERHKAAVDAGQRSVIMGTASFETGVDLPGAYCQLVIIAKLQFQSPADPLVEAQREYIESTGRSYFDEVMVPQACRRLAQSAGRLLRNESDTGRIVVTDPRLTGTRYGRAMLKALPPYKLDPLWAATAQTADTDAPAAAPEPALIGVGLQALPW